MKRTIIAFISVLLILGIIGLIRFWLYVCPILNNFPKPTGPHCVGYTHYHWTDKSLNSQNFGFNVELFYPSICQHNSSTLFHYQPKKMRALASIKATESWIPHFVWKCLVNDIFSYSELNAPLIDTKKAYPVLIYLPGIAGDDLHNLYLEELASHGYIICAIEPPYDTTVTIFPNNIIPLNQNLKKAIAKNDRDAIYAYRNQAHIQWNEHIKIAIEQLRLLHNDPQSMFYQKLDLDRLGLIGHSHGGAVVTDFCQQNNMCKAGVNMDGWTKTYNNGDAFNVPFLFLLSETGEMDEMKSLFEHNKRPDFKKMTIPGAGHLAFNDHALVKKPIAQWFGIVNTDASMVIPCIKNALVTFFNTYLNDHFNPDKS